jgi:integrase/recombinase XerD
MGWEHFHLYKFEYNLCSFEYNGYSTPSTTLNELNMGKSSALYYLYDFGDAWEHTIELEKITPKTKRERIPYCLDGKRACPPEDCGGPWGYKHYLSALKSKKGSKYRDAIEVMGRHFDPEKFDKSAVNKEIVEWLKDE